MPGRKRPVIFSPRALDDRETIELAGIDAWGVERSAAYITALDRACERIGDHPEIGRARDDLRPGLRSRPVGAHVVYYEIRRDSIWISRILHARQDPFAAADV